MGVSDDFRAFKKRPVSKRGVEVELSGSGTGVFVQLMLGFPRGVLRPPDQSLRAPEDRTLPVLAGKAEGFTTRYWSTSRGWLDTSRTRIPGMSSLSESARCAPAASANSMNPEA